MGDTNPQAARQSAPAKRVLVVLGAQRCGVSTMAELLACCGAKRLISSQPDGVSAGGCEVPTSAITLLNEEILTAYDTSWDDIFAGRPREHLSNFDRFYHHRVSAALAAESDEADLVVLEDARVSVLARLWNGAFEEVGYEPTYIIMVRHPLEVARSLWEGEAISREKSLLLWLDHMVAAERDTRGQRRVFVSTASLRESWGSQIQRVELAAERALVHRGRKAAASIERVLANLPPLEPVSQLGGNGQAGISRQVAAAYDCFVAAARDEPLDTQVLDEVQAHLADLAMTIGPVISELDDRAERIAAEARRIELQAIEKDDQLRLASARAEEASAERRTFQRYLDRLGQLEEEEARRGRMLEDFQLGRDETERQAREQAAECDNLRAALSELAPKLDFLRQENDRLLQTRVGTEGGAYSNGARFGGRPSNLARASAAPEKALAMLEKEKLALATQNEELRLEVGRLQLSREQDVPAVVVGHVGLEAQNEDLRAEIARLNAARERLISSLSGSPAAADGDEGPYSEVAALVASYREAREELRRVQVVRDTLSSRVDDLLLVDDLRRENQLLKLERENIFNSTSWKLTALPRRWIMKLKGA